MKTLEVQVGTHTFEIHAEPSERGTLVLTAECNGETARFDLVVGRDEDAEFATSSERVEILPVYHALG